MTEKEMQEIAAMMDEKLAASEARVLKEVERMLQKSVNTLKIELVPVIRKAVNNESDQLEDWR